jgi:hypothetical protein
MDIDNADDRAAFVAVVDDVVTHDVTADDAVSLESLMAAIAGHDAVVAVAGHYSSAIGPRVVTSDTPELDAIEAAFFPVDHEIVLSGPALRQFRLQRLGFQLARVLGADRIARVRDLIERNALARVSQPGMEDVYENVVGLLAALSPTGMHS